MEAWLNSWVNLSDPTTKVLFGPVSLMVTFLIVAILYCVVHLIVGSIKGSRRRQEAIDKLEQRMLEKDDAEEAHRLYLVHKHAMEEIFEKIVGVDEAKDVPFSSIVEVFKRASIQKMKRRGEIS